MDKAENLECLYQGYGILEEEWVNDSQCHSVLGSTVSRESMYAKYDPNPYWADTICTFSEDDLIICEVSKLLA